MVEELPIKHETATATTRRRNGMRLIWCSDVPTGRPSSVQRFAGLSLIIVLLLISAFLPGADALQQGFRSYGYHKGSSLGSQTHTRFKSGRCSSSSTRHLAAISKTSTTTSSSTQNGLDDEYPYCFTGRFLFSPALVKVPKDPGPPGGVKVLSLFGYTLGGVVALEYDTSPVGPYKEYVTMEAVVTKGASVGQWGSRLLVSTKQAADICQDLWGVPAEPARIEFVGNTKKKNDDQVLTSWERGLSDDHQQQQENNASVPQIQVNGWTNTQLIPKEELSKRKRYGRIPVMWTPTIKALWVSLFVPRTMTSKDNEENEDNKDKDDLPLHRLRLSASSIKLLFFQTTKKKNDPEEVSQQGMIINDDNDVTKAITSTETIRKNLGWFALVVDNVLIEISEQVGFL